MEAIKKGLKDIEDMIPCRFNFDFGKKEYTGSEALVARPVYEISDMLGQKNIRWRIFPTLELIVRYRHVLFQDGRTYVVGKEKTEITDIISLFEYLQTTRNYAIFNNLLNVMLIFIIDYVLDIVKSDGRTSTELIDNYINEHYRMLYRVIDDRVILLNSFIYGIEKEEVVYPDVKYDWDTCFYTLLENLRKRRRRRQELTSSSSPEKDVKILLNNLKKHIDELEYNMAIGHKLILSLQYQYIIDNIDEYASTIEETQSIFRKMRKMKVIYEKDNVDIILKDDDGLVEDVSDDVINDEIREELKSWMNRFIREATDSEKTVALEAYALYVRKNERRRQTGRQSVSKEEEDAYCKYAEAVSINSIIIYSPIFTLSRLHRFSIKEPIWMNYDKYMSKIKEEEEAKANELAIAKQQEYLRASLNSIEGQYKRRTKNTQQFGGVDPGSLFVLGSSLYTLRSVLKIKQTQLRTNPYYKGSDRVYMYPTLSTVIEGVSTKLFKKKLNIQILYSSQTKRLDIFYTQDFPEAYNAISIVKGNTRNTNTVSRGTKGKDKYSKNIDRTLLFKNKHILKDLYTNIKKYIDGRVR